MTLHEGLMSSTHWIQWVNFVEAKYMIIKGRHELRREMRWVFWES